jgi:hypothetical protein
MIQRNNAYGIWLNKKPASAGRRNGKNNRFVGLSHRGSRHNEKRFRRRLPFYDTPTSIDAIKLSGFRYAFSSTNITINNHHEEKTFSFCFTTIALHDFCAGPSKAFQQRQNCPEFWI